MSATRSGTRTVPSAATYCGAAAAAAAEAEAAAAAAAAAVAASCEGVGQTMRLASMAVGMVISSPHRHEASSGCERKAAKPSPKMVAEVPPAATPPVGCSPLAHASSKRTRQWAVSSGGSSREKTLGCT